MNRYSGTAVALLSALVIAAWCYPDSAAASSPAQPFTTSGAAFAQPIVIPPSCKKIEMGTCTSCSNPTLPDNECKSGGDFQNCNTAHFTCPNGAQCDAHTGIGSC